MDSTCTCMKALCIYICNLPCRPFAIVEFGPGLGKLMQDLLRGLEAFPEFLDGLSIHMIEASATLQKAQAKALGCDAGNAEPSANIHTQMQ